MFLVSSALQSNIFILFFEITPTTPMTFQFINTPFMKLWSFGPFPLYAFCIGNITCLIPKCTKCTLYTSKYKYFRGTLSPVKKTYVAANHLPHPPPLVDFELCIVHHMETNLLKFLLSGFHMIRSLHVGEVFRVIRNDIWGDIRGT